MKAVLLLRQQQQEDSSARLHWQHSLSIFVVYKYYCVCRKIDKVSVGGNPQKQWSEEATAFFYSLFFSVYNDGLISRPDIVRKLIHLVCSCRKVGNAAEMEIEILACFSLRQDIESYYEDEWSSYSCLAGAFCQNAASVQQNMCTMKRGLQGVPTSFKA